MTEKEITLLGFKKEYINDYEGDDSYYYALDIADGLTFISQTNKEVKDNEWNIDIFNTDPIIRFTKFEEVQSLINLLNKKIIKNDTV